MHGLYSHKVSFKFRLNAGEGTNHWRTSTNCTAQSVSLADCSSSRRAVVCPDSERIAIICTECKYHHYGFRNITIMSYDR